MKFLNIARNIVPIVLMIALIPFVSSDYYLTGIYILIIAAALWAKYESKDFLALIVGFVAMTVSEYFFISTGVETFNRISFLGVMPLWLPFLWAYGFVAIKRVVKIL